MRFSERKKRGAMCALLSLPFTGPTLQVVFTPLKKILFFSSASSEILCGTDLFGFLKCTVTLFTQSRYMPEEQMDSSTMETQLPCQQELISSMVRSLLFSREMYVGNQSRPK